MNIDLNSWNATKLQKKQTELTRLANGITKQADGRIFTAKEKQKLEDAAQILNSFKHQVTHAKEKAARLEREKKRATDASIKHAQRILKQQANQLTLSQKIELSVRNNDTCCWPYGSYPQVLETLNKGGIDTLNRRIQETINDWTQAVARSMGWAANSDYKPEPVNTDTAQYRINKAIAGDGADISTTQLQQILDRIQEMEGTHGR